MDLAAVAEDGFGYVVNRPGDVREVRPTVILTHSPNPLPEFGSAANPVDLTGALEALRPDA